MEGNKQKMRDALIEIEKMAHCDLGNVYPKYRNKFDNLVGGIERIARAALSAPPRQCDVGTPEEQAKRMDAYCASHGERIGGSWRCDNCPLCSLDRCDLVWAQMPYEAQEGGSK